MSSHMSRTNRGPAKHAKAADKAAKQPAKQPYLVHNSIVSYYLLLMFSFFTIFLSRKDYSNSRHDKFYLYLGLSGVMVIGAGVAFFLAAMEQNRIGRSLSAGFLPITAADGAFLCFTVCALVSTFASEYFPGTFLAEFGRNNGMLLLFFYALVYFIISRMYVCKDYVIAVFLIASCLIALLTVLNFFYIDPLGLLEGYKGTFYEPDFGSTIGNKNTIASYMAMFVPVAVMTSVLNEKRFMRVIALIAVAFAYTGALCANSGSVIMGLAVTVPVMAVFSAQRYERLMRFLTAMTVLFTSAKLLMLFSALTGDNSKGFEYTQDFLIYHPAGYLPILLCAGAALLMYRLRTRLEPRYRPKAITVTLLALTGALVAGMIGAILYFSLADTTTALGKAEQLFRFNDRWGTHRGFMWIRSLREYGGFGFFRKLFGAGPDTAYYILEPYFEELNARFHNTSTNCAHNEYINYLITQGALGLLSYLAILGTVCVRTLRRARQNPTALIFLSAVICYAIQGTVNIYQPITTPLFFLFLSMAEALNRQTHLKNE